MTTCHSSLTAEEQEPVMESEATTKATTSCACPRCGEVDAQTIWPDRPRRSAGPGPGPFQIASCPRCELWFTVPRLSGEEIGAYYPDVYYGARNKRFHPLMELLTRWFRRHRAMTLERFTPRGRVLDIGCGRGVTLAALRERGWQTQGVELTAAAAECARHDLGLDVKTGGFDPADYPDEHFDAVILWHVLEHVPNLPETLAGAARILKQGGVLAVAVPNRKSWQARLTGYDWFHLDLPRHYWHFSADWLTSALRENGLRVAHIRYGSLEQNPYGWIQSLLNRCGLRHNLLYDLLRSRSARTVERPWREYPLQSLLSLIGLAVLVVPAVAMVIPEIIFRAGGTMDIYAVKE